MNIFLDSSAIIGLFKNNSSVSNAINEAEVVYTSTMCAYEVLLGEEYMKNKSRVSRAQRFFEIAATLPLTYQDSTKAAILTARLSTKGKKVDDFDILIAVQVLQNNATMLTKDITHFEIISEETGLVIKKIS